MARDFITLSDMPQAVLGITCDLCQRHAQFDVEALKAQHGGDVKMPELLGRLVADCPRQKAQRQAFSVYDRCRAKATIDLKFRAVFSHRRAARLKRLSRPTPCSMRERAL